LDGRAKEGQWVGFDDSKAHQIYWAEKRSVTVERSVRFIGGKVVGEGMPFKGEMKDFDEAEEDKQANDNFIPTKNNKQ
jgi:hypothetical protein